MKSGKRIFSLMLALVMCFVMLGAVPAANAASIDYNNYDLIDWQPKYSSYWNSTGVGDAAVTLQTGMNGFISSGVMFTKNDLPEGTIIEIDNGYQYRPEGWKSLEQHYARPDNTSAAQVIVDAAWWGEYNYRAFNVSKVDGGAFAESDVAAVKDALRIYVPKKQGKITITAYDAASGKMDIKVENASGIVTVASYDANGSLDAITSYTTDAVAANPTVEFNAASDYQNVFCWDSFAGMKPLADKVSTKELGSKVEISMSRGLRASSTLTAVLNDLNALYYEYQWLQSADGVNFTNIITETSQTYYISSQDKGRYLAVDVTPVYANNVKGDTIRSADRLYVENLGNIVIDSPTASKRFATRYTPDENRFTIEGSTRPYVLLDRYDDEDSAFYILADYITTPRLQHESDPQRINPQDEESIGYWLNNNYAKTGYEIAGVNKEPLEADIYNYVDKNHKWWVEAGIDGVDGDDTEDYYYTAGIGMPTQTETMKYIDRFGWNVASEHGNWFVNWQTATGSEDTGQYVVVDNFPIESVDKIYNAGEHKSVGMTPSLLPQDKWYYVRPSFYLNRDFFTNVRLNVGSVGKNIKKMLKAVYTPAELAVIYSEEEIKALGMYDEDEPDVPDIPTEGLKVLAIGNSFSVDSMEYLYNIADELTDENVVLGNMYIGGCTLNMHNTNAKTNATAYTYYKNTNGVWNESNGYTLQRGIMDEDWDIIVMQQASGVSGMPDTYNNDLTELAAYVKSKATNPGMRLGWNMTWAYQQDSTHVEFPNYNSDQMTMYNAITNAVQTKIVTNSDFDFVIPVGTAIQNTRTSYIGDTLTRDGFHLSIGIGRYIAALTWAKQITGAASVDTVTWVPSAAAVNPTYLEIAKESVANAYTTPYAVTASKYAQEPVDVSITSDTSNVCEGTTLTASLGYPNAASYEYQWLTSKDGVNFEPIYGRNTNSYIITNQDKNNTITCEVTPVMADGTKAAAVRAKAAFKIAKLGPVPVKSPSAEERFATRQTPAENQFMLAGGEKRYVLLDKFNDNSSAFYVMADFLTANVHAVTDSKDVAAQDDEGSVGYWLNNTYLNDGYDIAGMHKDPIEASVYKYVDKSHTWWAGSLDGNAEDVSYKAGISLLTESEAHKYNGVYGWQVGTEHGNWTNPWLLATGNRAKNEYVMMMNYGGYTDVSGIGGAGEHPIANFNTFGGEVYARPTFYLGTDFFKNVKLDVNSMGENVKKVIRDTYTADELGIYSIGELRAIGYVIADAVIESDTAVIGAKTTLTASMGDENAVSYEYQWLSAAAEDGVYTPIKTAKSNKYYVTNQDKNSYLKCRITPVYADGAKGASTISNTVHVETLGLVTPENIDVETLKATRNTPDEYKFAIAGSTRAYSLLDEFADSNSAYYVLADYLTSNVEYDSVDPGHLNPDSITSIAYWLNNDFAKNGYNFAGADIPKLEEEIYSHVDKNHKWWVEAGVSEAGDNNEYSDYSYTAGIGLLTESEAVKYMDRFGWNVATEHGKWYHRWYLATGNNATDKYLVVRSWEIGEDGALNGTGEHYLTSVTPGTHDEMYARPAFYLDYDFFKTVKLDLSKTGDAVKNILKANYKEEELKGIYDYTDLAELGFETPVSISGNKNNEIYINLNYTNTTSNPVMSIVVNYTNGDVSDSYTYEEILWEGETLTEQIPVKTLPLGDNTITVTLVIDEVVAGTLTQNIVVTE